MKALSPHRILVAAVLAACASLAACESVKSLTRSSDDPSLQAIVEVEGETGSEEIVVHPSRYPESRQGVAKLRTQSWSEAVALLAPIVLAHPKDHRSHFAMGVAYEAMQDFGQAQESYKRALELQNEPEYEYAWTRINWKLGMT